MWTFFDYVYYKLAKAYYKWDKDSGSTALAGLTLMQTLMLGCLILIPERLMFPVSTTSKYTKTTGYIALIIVIIIFILNYIRYSKKYPELEERWKDESYPVIKGALVILALAAPLIILLIGVENLKTL
jgi:amino acid transporter